MNERKNKENEKTIRIVLIGNKNAVDLQFGIMNRSEPKKIS